VLPPAVRTVSRPGPLMADEETSWWKYALYTFVALVGVVVLFYVLHVNSQLDQGLIRARVEAASAQRTSGSSTKKSSKRD